MNDRLPHDSQFLSEVTSLSATSNQCDHRERERLLTIARHMGLLGSSAGHIALLQNLFRVAQIDVEVMLVGETGVGKELYAKFLHACSKRAKGPFVAVNCAAIPDSLFENELFGHVEGAYTDARSKSGGLIAASECGSLFFDEVDQLSIRSQVKLLRLLQEKEYRRLGESQLRKADIRVISAMNSDPEISMKEGKLREDLYYRLNVVKKTVPPLRDRIEDVEILVKAFVERYSKEYQRDLILTPRAILTLIGYHWPGNIRQLENLIRGIVCEFDASTIDESLLSIVPNEETVKEFARERVASLISHPLSEAKRLLVEEFERLYVAEMLRQTDGNLSKAARLAGKPVRSFRRTVRDREIELEKFRPDDTMKAN